MQSILDLCGGLPEATFDCNQFLLVEGENSGRLFILIEGQIEVLKGPFQVHVSAEPGSMFGEISALLGIPHTATVRTLAPSRLHVVEQAGAFLGSRPDLALGLSKLLAQRLYSVTTYLADMKAQFGDRKDHLGMVDEVLEALLHQQGEAFEPGSARHPDPKI